MRKTLTMLLALLLGAGILVSGAQAADRGSAGGAGLYVTEETAVAALGDAAARDGYRHVQGYFLELDRSELAGPASEQESFSYLLDYPAGFYSADGRAYRLAEDGAAVVLGNVSYGPCIELSDMAPESGTHIALAWNDDPNAAGPVSGDTPGGEPEGPRGEGGDAGDPAAEPVTAVFSYEDDEQNSVLGRAAEEGGFPSATMYAVRTADGRTLSAGAYDCFRLWCPDNMLLSAPYVLLLYRDGGAEDVTRYAVLEEHKDGCAVAVSGLDVENGARFALGMSIRHSWFSVLGDINGDGAVDRKDRIYLARYLAGWDGYELPDEAAADVNGDGAVDRKDRIYLARYLAGWDGYEL